MGWTYIKENICTDNVVAYFVNDNGYRICDVYEGANGYYTNEYVRGIKLPWIEYSTARSMNSLEEEQGTSAEVLFNGMKHACELLEKEYVKQVEELKRILM